MGLGLWCLHVAPLSTIF